MAIQTGEGAIDLIAPPSMAKVHVANSEFILRAVNCHDELVDLLKYLQAEDYLDSHALGRVEAMIAKAEAK